MEELPSQQIQNTLVSLVFHYWLIRLNHINVKMDRLIKFRQVYHFFLEKTVGNRALISKDFTSHFRDLLGSYLLSWASANPKKVLSLFPLFLQLQQSNTWQNRICSRNTHDMMVWCTSLCVSINIDSYTLCTHAIIKIASSTSFTSHNTIVYICVDPWNIMCCFSTLLSG